MVLVISPLLLRKVMPDTPSIFLMLVVNSTRNDGAALTCLKLVACLVLINRAISAWHCRRSGFSREISAQACTYSNYLSAHASKCPLISSINADDLYEFFVELLLTTDEARPRRNVTRLLRFVAENMPARYFDSYLQSILSCRSLSIYEIAVTMVLAWRLDFISTSWLAKWLAPWSVGSGFN